MFLLNICIYVGLILSVCQFAHQSCTDGTPQQCKDAEMAPGTNLAGEGFDITSMERKGAYVLDMNLWQRKDKKCLLCTNPYVENKQQKLPLSVADWRSKQSCSMKVSSKLHRSSESLVSSVASSIENDWKVGLDFGMRASLMLAGTHSKLADYSSAKSKNDKFSFTSQSVFCEYYSYRVSTDRAKLHRDFRKAVENLPKSYSPETKERYYRLINNFGTHFITKVKLGGIVQSVTSIKQCQASLQGLSVEEVQMCLEAEASGSAGMVTASAQIKHCKKDIEKTESKSSFSDLFSDRFTEIKGGRTEFDLLFSADKDPSAYKEWLNTIPQIPDILSYSLDALHELLPPKSPEHKNLKKAISHYILERGLLRNCSSPCKDGRKSDSRDPCVCQCHNNPEVTSDCCPSRKGMARVIITVQRATDLWGDHFTATDGYVKVFFNGKMVQESRVINNNNNPHWNTVVDMRAQDLSSGQKVRFEVWDDDHKWDDLLGNCEQDLTPGVKEDVCALQHGRFFYKVEMTCAPSLTGNSCMEYKPSPMSQSLSKLYVSRHAHRIPKDILLEMGVFVDAPSSQRNQSVAVDN